jgi:hypothetical protein
MLDGISSAMRSKFFGIPTIFVLMTGISIFLVQLVMTTLHIKKLCICF